MKMKPSSKSNQQNATAAGIVHQLFSSKGSPDRGQATKFTPTGLGKRLASARQRHLPNVAAGFSVTISSRQNPVIVVRL